MADTIENVRSAEMLQSKPPLQPPTFTPQATLRASIPGSENSEEFLDWRLSMGPKAFLLIEKLSEEFDKFAAAAEATVAVVEEEEEAPQQAPPPPPPPASPRKLTVDSPGEAPLLPV